MFAEIALVMVLNNSRLIASDVYYSKIYQDAGAGEVNPVARFWTDRDDYDGLLAAALIANSATSLLFSRNPVLFYIYSAVIVFAEFATLWNYRELNTTRRPIRIESPVLIFTF